MSPAKFAINFHGPYALCHERVDCPPASTHDEPRPVDLYWRAVWQLHGDPIPDCPNRNQAGLYLWAVKQLSGRYRLTCIDQTVYGRPPSSFLHRMTRHIHQILSGHERSMDPDQMERGSGTVLWGEKLDRIGPYPESACETLVPLIKRYLMAQQVFVAPWEADARILRRIEGALHHSVRSQPEASSLLPPRSPYVARRKKEVAIAVTISLEDGVEVEGLPRELIL